jgi:P4 family phage/plasmid primase-like protien
MAALADEEAFVIRFAIFKSAKDATAGAPTVAPWTMLPELLGNPRHAVASKDQCKLLKLGAFGKTPNGQGNFRTNENLEIIYGVEGDYDQEEISIDEGAARLEAAGIKAFLYTTARHSEVKPRWRVLAPLSRRHAAVTRSAMLDRLNGALGGILGPESWTAAQIFYFGRIEGVPYEARSVEGEFLDLCDHITPMGKQPKKPAELHPAVAPSIAAPALPAANDLDAAIVIANVTEKTLEELASALATISADDRGTWIKCGHALKSLQATEYAEQAFDLWATWSQTSSKYQDGDEQRWDGFTADKIDYRAIFNMATAAGWKNPKKADYSTQIDHTDTGNANLLARLTDGDLRYVPERNMWIWWTGERWVTDEHGAYAQAAALRVAQHYHTEAARLKRQATSEALDEAGRKRLLTTATSLSKWEKQCRNSRTINAMLSVASRQERLQKHADELDRDPWLLGVLNGVVDLRNGKLRPAGRDDFVTKRAAARFDPNAPAPRWRAVVDEVTGSPPADGLGGDGRYIKRPHLASYLHRAMGYLIMGKVTEQKMLIFTGAGSNGKNVVLDLLQYVLGDYCQTIAPEALMATRHDADAERPTPTAAGLAGARTAISSESKDGQRLDGALVKRHTGGGYMTARMMRENTFRFEITHKLVLMTNYRPRLDHLDEALRGRLHLVPFDRRWNRPGHSERNPALPDGDKDLIEHLKREAEGILAWLVQGAGDYAVDGLEPPTEVVRMTRDYFQEQDAFGRWFEGYLDVDLSQGSGSAELFDEFCKWCEREELANWSPSTQKAFSAALHARGVASKTTKSGKRWGLKKIEIDFE